MVSTMKKFISLFMLLVMCLSPLQANDDHCLLDDSFGEPCAEPTSVRLSSESQHGVFIALPDMENESVQFLRLLGVVGVLMAFDQPLMDFVQDHRSDFTDQLSDYGDLMGGRNGLVPFVLGSYAVGLVFRSPKLRRTALMSIANAALTGAITEVLKALTHRHRPADGNGPYQFDGASWPSDNTSFPSGHSTAAWAVATIFATSYSQTPWVPVVAYGVAAIVSWSRVHDLRHWASDVVLGAGIGYFFGKFLHKLFNREVERNRNSGFLISPIVLNRGGGIQVSWTPNPRCHNVEDCLDEPDYIFDEDN